MSTDSSYVDGTDQALRVAVSVWPIIFAGIVAQSLRAYATYRVERGVRLMVSRCPLNKEFFGYQSLTRFLRP